jgi:hypothetical protein
MGFRVQGLRSGVESLIHEFNHLLMPGALVNPWATFIKITPNAVH